MKLTPLDIRKHVFARKLRGYDPDEVRPFLEMVSQQWEEMQEEVRHANDRVREMENKIRHYEKVEVALQEALEAAKSSAHRTQTHAEERARLLLQEAELKVEQMMREAEQDHFRLRHDVSKLTHRHAEVTARLRHFLMSELEILAQHEEERPIGFMKLIPAREAEALPSADEPPSQEARSQEARVQETSARETSGREAPAATGGPSRQSGSEGPSEAAAASGTTYADLYARASRRARDQEAERPEAPAHVEPPEEEEPAWTLRSLVTDEPREEDPRRDPPASEKEHIRRILEDLD
jgi:cell division initiation protein